MKLDWNDIDTVLLDMDGTLLDRHFDDHFWLEHVPHTYARKHALSVQEAKDILIPLFRSQEKTLNWTDLDYWSDRLGLDIPLLKQEVDHLIALALTENDGLTRLVTELHKHWLYARHPGFTSDNRLGHLEQPTGRIQLPPRLYRVKIAARL